MSFYSFCKHIAKVILKREKISFVSNSPQKNDFENETVFYADLDETKLVSKNKSPYKNLIAIDGVGFSGSSAIGDFLGEFSNCTSLGGVDPRENPDRGIENFFEIDFLREIGGLLDLEKICYTNCGRIRDDAVHQFIKVCRRYYEGGIYFFDDYFYELSKKFVNDITSYAYFDSPSHISYVAKRLSVEEFREKARNFMLSILKNIPSKEYLVCDNLTAIGRPDKGILKDYLGDYKVLMSYSDPRDIYARARLSGGNDWVPSDPEIFVKNWNQNAVPCINNNDKNTLVTYFDDFCNNYESESKRIMDFLGLDEKDHIEKFKYFNPKISINNTQVWKKLDNQKPIDYIFANLKEFCYDSDKHQKY